LQEASERPFDIAAVPKDVKPQATVEKKSATSKKVGKDVSQNTTANGGLSSGPDSYEKLLNSIPEFAGFGKLFKVFFHTKSSISCHHIYWTFFTVVTLNPWILKHLILQMGDKCVVSWLRRGCR
jgi:hypothetical protein